MEMTRNHFVQELGRLQDEILLLGSMVSESISAAVRALQEKDLQVANRLIAYDRTINAKKYQIEDDCLTVIATQQPAARDLRLLAAVLEISTELERMGDYAKGISRITIYIGPEPRIKPPVEFVQMCDLAMDMLKRALNAFVDQDEEAARSIPREDDRIDALYNRVNHDLINNMIADPTKTDHANYLSWAAHNLERSGDRVTNICERVLYTVTGEFMEFDATEPLYSGVN
jgi:phosphate transport system protein